MRKLLCGLLLAGATPLQAAEIHVMSSNALKTVLEELVPHGQLLLEEENPPVLVLEELLDAGHAPSESP